MGIYRDRQKKIEADNRPLTDETLEELGFGNDMHNELSNFMKEVTSQIMELKVSQNLIAERVIDLEKRMNIFTGSIVEMAKVSNNQQGLKEE